MKETINNLFKKIKTSKLLKAQIAVIIICLFFGTLLHFTYEWSGENFFVGIFSAVNESVWEHLKLVFYPMLIMGIIEYFYVKDIVNNYLEAKTIGIFSAMSFIITSFYTYTGIIGTKFLIIDVLIFIISIIVGEWVAYKLMTRKDESTTLSTVLSIGILLFFLISFTIFTYSPPTANLFVEYKNLM